MSTIPSPTDIRRIEIFSQWIGFAYPPSTSAKLTITNTEGRFIRQQALVSTSDEVPELVISRIVTALARPAVPELDVTLFDAPGEDVERHFNCCWTEDNPSLLIRITCDGERLITVRSHAQYTFMLPLNVADSATSHSYATFDPELSRALAGLMPEEFLGQVRLAGDPEVFARERAEAELLERHRRERETVDADEATTKEPGQTSTGSQTNTEAATRGEFPGFTHPHSLTLAVLRQQLAKGANPSAADESGTTALMYLSYTPFRPERFRLLLEAGADVEARQKDGWTGLHLACHEGSSEVVDEWLRAGASIFARTPGGATPLMLGATWPRIVATLLDHQAEVNAVDEDGHSALTYIILRQQSFGEPAELKSLRLLISAGADVNAPDRSGIRPLAHAKKVLAEASLEEEIIQELHPDRALNRRHRWSLRKMAAAFVTILKNAGAHD